MNTKLSILFFVKRTKTNVNGLLPIFIRVTVNGERIEFTTKRFTTSEKWSVEGNRMKGTSAESKATNSYLDALKAKVSDIDIRKIDHEFITSYEFYLKTVCNCCQNTTSKYIKNFGKIIHICLANGWLERNPFINYKSKMVEVERAFLSQDEIETMFNKEFTTDRLNQVKDIFLFSCFTGLAYSDVKKLSYKNIGIGVDSERWIFINRTKTDTRSNIPLLPIASAILKKYENHPQVVNQERLLPILSNQKMNSYLKEIADLCGINKELTFHIARHTFATTVTLSNGVPIGECIENAWTQKPQNDPALR